MNAVGNRCSEIYYKPYLAQSAAAWVDQEMFAVGVLLLAVPSAV